jgi:hypothetical protein
VAQKPEEPLMRRRLATLLPDCRVEAAGRTSALQLNSAALRWTCRDTQSEKKKKKKKTEIRTQMYLATPGLCLRMVQLKAVNT